MTNFVTYKAKTFFKILNESLLKNIPSSEFCAKRYKKHFDVSDQFLMYFKNDLTKHYKNCFKLNF